MTQPTVVMTFILLLFTHHSYAVIWRLPAVSDSSRALPRKTGARPSSSDTAFTASRPPPLSRSHAAEQTTRRKRPVLFSPVVIHSLTFALFKLLQQQQMYYKQSTSLTGSKRTAEQLPLS